MLSRISNFSGPLSSISSGGIRPFISTWRTTTAYEIIDLPLLGSYNLVVNWGDGVTEIVTDVLGNHQHVYTNLSDKGMLISPCDYTITISGTMDGWSFRKFRKAGDPSLSKITSIRQFGCLKIDNYGEQFGGCVNLTLDSVSDVLNLTGITDLSGMFHDCTTSLSTINNINSWNVSNVTSMSNMFYGTPFNQDISSWDVSNVTSMSYMFYGTPFNQDISSWDVSNVTSMSGMFQNSKPFNSDISNWNVSSVSVMENMFTNAISFNRDISNWNISNVVFMSNFMSGKSTANYSYYDNLLNAWSKLKLRYITPKGGKIVLGMGNIQYTSVGQVARQSIIDTYGWVIKDGGMI